ncbi:hypothetical protein DXJ84_20810 [Vibrio parahaemolyticus]|uniref:hypothetical protein n=1 Tax=Vibrio parahaemolyticus TaxID=670 RepID=UPI00112206BF|nr:hypothetical protein [Vibrio parahaemolyticus]TPA23134.1 hypothetical protein DXJ84_20810 [Vibrio parahaemolyticus]
MKAILYSSALLAALMVPSVAAESKTHTFHVSSDIDRSNMLADTVNLKLEPSSIMLAYDPATNTFFDKTIKLVIESDIYLYESELEVSSYQLFLISNASSCYSSTSPDIENKLDGYDNIANVHIDNKLEPMNIGEAVIYSNKKFNSVNSVLTHDLVLKFKVLKLIGEETVRSCNGSFVVGFRYDL